MKYETKTAKYINETWCSPCVGTFKPEINPCGTMVSIGRIRQMGRTYEVVLPSNLQNVVLLFSDTRSVEYGTPLAKCVQAENKILDQDQKSESFIDIVAPCDGFLQTTRSDGTPLFCKGDIVEPGSTIAVIELMKLGVDVIYNGNTKVRFVEYTSSVTVKCGACVAKVEVYND